MVMVEAAGLCHSELHIINGAFPASLPLVLGHEATGVLEDIGPGVSKVKPGDQVVRTFVPSCGLCRYCSTGRQNLGVFGDQPDGPQIVAGTEPVVAVPTAESPPAGPRCTSRSWPTPRGSPPRHRSPSRCSGSGPAARRPLRAAAPCPARGP
ncbi:alcohol dehydrogenase catalytic domain-containing protein [Streptomyces sp. NPDC005538]|uniref:alcohol dehydrogenase catalytic domain-containing protein n=1 Tax=unclassified Streptomyces TaxID=2593676 RepID=UPI0033AAA313